eukprot:CAMPEP_0197861004 /NCGR_PEP_ID=MMETSP1438-20131217/36764_1 /TAXON_ID=1461541 /ORGANISM="Pterosperma sp., Strain CCMP1384" /LENGTH=39 /DNA_ID= /DNA_START= /DNA_END= /DNA_ORIENTATION=
MSQQEWAALQTSPQYSRPLTSESPAALGPPTGTLGSQHL